LFTGAAVAEKRTGIRSVIRAYDRAVADLTEDPDRFRDLIVEVGGFPPTVRDTMVLPEYAPPRPPSRRMVEDVAAWMMERGLIAFAPAYEDIVDQSLLGN
jgi:NitT/TauT family transport system substrate-binding protein